jgi:hypothetical protein
MFGSVCDFINNREKYNFCKNCMNLFEGPKFLEYLPKCGRYIKYYGISWTILEYDVLRLSERTKKQLVLTLLEELFYI